MSDKCEKCGFQNDDGALECQNCGIVFSKYRQFKSNEGELKKISSSFPATPIGKNEVSVQKLSHLKNFKVPVALTALVLLLLVALNTFLLQPYLRSSKFAKEKERILENYKIYKQSFFGDGYDKSYSYLSELTKKSIPKVVWSQGVADVEKKRKSKVTKISFINSNKAKVQIKSKDFNTNRTATHYQTWIKEKKHWRLAYLQNTLLKDFNFFLKSLNDVDYVSSYKRLSEKTKKIVPRKMWEKHVNAFAKKYNSKIVNLVVLSPKKARIDTKVSSINNSYEAYAYSTTWLKENNIWRRAYAEDSTREYNLDKFGHVEEMRFFP